MEGPRTLRAAGVSFTCLLWFCRQPSLFSLSLSSLFSLLSFLFPLGPAAHRPLGGGTGRGWGVRAEPARIFLLSSAQRGWVRAASASAPFPPGVSSLLSSVHSISDAPERKWRQIPSRERDLPFPGPGSREQSRRRRPLAGGERVDSELYS
jgi:hypothetical protein